MCGIIGFCGINSPETRKLLANLIYESAYRGKHSTGLVSYNGGSLDLHHLTPEHPCYGAPLEYSLAHMTMGVPALCVIAHTRYCTSDLSSPLPIVNNSTAVVLNGVITQEPFEAWPTYGYLPYKSKNDAEIALRLAQLGRVTKTPGSYAMCFLRDNGLITGVRSPERPLWYHVYQWEAGQPYAYAFTSTLDIAKRASVGATRVHSQELKPGMIVGLNDSVCFDRWETSPDLQIRSLSPPVAPCKL